MRRVKVAVAGATGAVGREMLKVLEKYKQVSGSDLDSVGRAA